MPECFLKPFFIIKVLVVIKWNNLKRAGTQQAYFLLSFAGGFLNLMAHESKLQKLHSFPGLQYITAHHLFNEIKTKQVLIWCVAPLSILRSLVWCGRKPLEYDHSEKLQRCLPSRFDFVCLLEFAYELYITASLNL